VEQQYITDEFGIMRANPNYTGGVFNPQNPYAQNAMQPYWQSVDQAASFPQNFTQTMAAIESQGGQNLTSPTGAVGPFQFTGIAANQVGIPKAQTVDPYIGAQAAAELSSQNRDRFMQAYGREPTGSELYLMHQQGANGAMAVLGTQDGTTINQLTPTVQRNIMAQGIQGINRQSPVSDFVDIFDRKYSQYEPFTGSQLQPQNSQMGGGYQSNLYGYGNDGFDTGFYGGGDYTGGFGNAQYNKGSMSGTGSGGGLVYDPNTMTYVPQSQQYGNNQYGYGNTSYNSQDYGYQQDYSGGFMGGQNTTGYMNYTPDITVYANDPWGMGTGSYMPQTQTDQYGQPMGGSGATLYSAAAELGGGMTMADTVASGQVYDAAQQYAQNFANDYQNQLNNQMQTQNTYGQNQFNQNMANTGTSIYSGGGNAWTQYQPY
jgi:hypothetical protein